MFLAHRVAEQRMVRSSEPRNHPVPFYLELGTRPMPELGANPIPEHRMVLSSQELGARPVPALGRARIPQARARTPPDL